MSGRIHSFKNYTVISGGAAYSRITVGSAPVTIAPPPFINAATIRIIANTSTGNAPAVNYRLDGVNPTTTTGLPAFNGDVIEIFMQELGLMRLVSADGNDQTVCIEFANVS